MEVTDRRIIRPCPFPQARVRLTFAIPALFTSITAEIVLAQIFTIESAARAAVPWTGREPQRDDRFFAARSDTHVNSIMSQQRQPSPGI
jgi:hypothetical protein